MAVALPCHLHNCRHIVTDAQHYEDALEKLRAHFRMEHPTKALNEHRLGQDFDSYNLTLDEFFDTYHPGIQWRQPGTLTDRQITEVCRRVRRSARVFNPEVVQEAITISAQHGQVLDPFDPNARQQDGLIAGADIPFEFLDDPVEF